MTKSLSQMRSDELTGRRRSRVDSLREEEKV